MKNQEQTTILLVEDDTVAAMVETHILKSFGYAVVAAKSGEEAVQIATGNDDVALILMDINLGPGMDGTQAAKQILEKRHLPIVFLTAHTEKEYVERVKAITRYGYVLKASDKFVLQSSIEMAFELFEANEALRKSEERLSMAQGVEKAGSWDWDIVTGHIIWSLQMFHLFGLDPQRNVASFEVWKSIIHPEDMEVAGLRIDQALKQQKTLNSDYRIVLPDGQMRWINAVGQGEYDAQGRPVRMIGICMDITERKKMEEALRDSERILRQAQEVSRVGYFITDVKTGIWKSSPVLDGIFGIDASFVRNIENWGTIIAPEYRQKLLDYYYKVIHEKTRFDMDYKVVRPIDGQERWVWALGEFDYDSSGNPVRQIGTIQDITERKQAEAEMAKVCAGLEDKVQARTAELQARLTELERFRQATVEREFRIKELCDEIERLKAAQNR